MPVQNAGSASGIEVLTIGNKKLNTISSTSVKNDEEDDIPADFETALKATGFGKFNILVWLTMIPSGFATSFSATAMSYVFPIAQCDLNLTLDNKGMLNSVSYIGMLSSGFLWGFLTDTLGRKKLLIFVFILDGVFITICGFSQTYVYLLISKFFEGFIVNGGYAAMLTYVNEFHTAQYRPLIPLFNGMCINCGSVVLPLLAWAIFSDNINISIFNDLLVLRSWNIYLFVLSIPSIIAALLVIAFPESPKFLMTTGKNEQALEVFRKVYKSNTGIAASKYPINILVDEPKLHDNVHGGHVTSNRSNVQALKEGWQQITPLFYPPYNINMLIILIVQFGFQMGMNTVRLWSPQIFAAINDYETIKKEESFDFCATLTMLNSGNVVENGTCFVNYNSKSVYINNIICASVAIVILLFSLPCVRIFGKKIVLTSGGVFAGLCIILIYYAENIVTTVALFSLHVGCMYVATNVVLSTAIDLFPTTLRAMAVSLAMISARLGSSTGNLIFPTLLTSGCFFPFLTLGCIVIGGALLAMLLPNTDMKSLK